MRQPATKVVGLGTGMMGGIGFPEYFALGGRFKAIGGRNSERVSQFLDRDDISFPEVELSGSFEQVLDYIERNPGFVDHAYVASIPKFHEQHAHFAIDERLDLLLEKGGMGGSPDLVPNIEQAILDSGIAFDVNSHYRKHHLLDVSLRSLITGEDIEDNLQTKIGESGLGEVRRVKIEYPQGYQENPEDPLGWKAYIAEAGRGKNVSDLGIHMIYTILDLFDAKFSNFEGQTYNVHPVRWNPAEGGQTFTTETTSDAENIEMNMLDSSTYNGDDVSTATFVLETENGSIPGTMYTSQVEGHESVRRATLLTPGDDENYGRLNGLAVQVEFENGLVTFRQKNPNTLEITDTDGSNYRVYERHEDPSSLGGPFQHASGNALAMRKVIYDMFQARAGGSNAVQAFTEANVERMVEADRVAKEWLKPELQPMAEYRPL
tara:strand:- start:454 stop:1755 length:1302 start_codon:yes stop_codon:yes gene_type:complete